MIHISQLKEMVGITSLDKLEIERYQNHLLGKEQLFNQSLAAWAENYDLHCGGAGLLLPNYFKSMISGAYQDDFYVIQYHQALHWLNCGLTQNRIMLILSQMRKHFILYAEEVESNTLAKGLCHVLDVGQSIVSSVFMVSESIERMKTRSDNEIRRLKNSYRLIAVDVPQDILQAYIDHQKWKMMAFELALGRKVDVDQFERNHHHCKLGKWLQNGGVDRIPVSRRESFDQAHEQVHRLGVKAIDEALHERPESIVELLFEMESASEEVMDVLLNVIEEEFVKAANSDVLTGFANRRAFDMEFEKALAFAKRHDFWVDLVLLDVDFFKKVNDDFGHITGDEVLKRIADILKEVARTEDMLFRWGGEEFVMITLDKEPEGAGTLAERVRVAIEKEVFFKGSDREMRLTISCGAVSYWAGLGLPEHEVFAVADKQLYQAKQSGRNKVCHTVFDVMNINTHQQVLPEDDEQVY